MPFTPDIPQNLFADTLPPVARQQADDIFFFSVEAYPEPGSPSFGTSGGAFIHCYVDAADLRAAERRMMELLRREQWRPHRLEGWEITSPNCADRLLRDSRGMSQHDLVCDALACGHALSFYPCDEDGAERFQHGAVQEQSSASRGHRLGLR